MVQLGEEVRICSVFKKMLYESDNFHIMKVSAKYAPDLFPFSEKDMPDEFTVKGSFSAPNYEGQEIELGGDWRFDAKYKEHIFNAQYVVAVLPTTEQGTLKFLQSIEGIGKKMSARICSVLNGDIRNLVLDEDWLLANIKGMNRSRADKVCNAIRRANATAELTKALRGAVTGEIIQKVVVKYGSNALDVINSTPYRMVYDHTLPFKDADTIALSLGVCQKDSSERVQCGILSALRAIEGRHASIIALKEDVQRAALTLLGVDQTIYDVEVKKMYENRTLVSAARYCYRFADFVAEKTLASYIVNFTRSKIPPSESQKFLKEFEKWEAKHPEVKLADQQEEAVKAVASHHLSVLTGGPGTGKTTVLKAILDAYRATYPDANVTLLAPTGLAAKRMSEACGFPASTVHKALGLTPSESAEGFDDSNSVGIDGGLVIVDESSMLGIHLMRFLFDSILFSSNTRIVIVGDIDQLPSVSPGAVLDAMISSQKIKTTRLNRNFRQEAGSAIVDAAYAINAGNTNLQFGGNFQYKEISNADIAVETQRILDEVKRAFVWSIKYFGLDQTYVLTPRKKMASKNGQTTVETLLSTQSLNPILRDIANPPSADKAFLKAGGKTWRVGDRVMNLKNTSEAMNGEIGNICEIRKEDVPVVVVDFDGTEVEYTPDKLKNLDWAYAITVHKSQGGEYKSIIYPTSMTQVAMLQRNLLYTAVTRARENVLIIGSRSSINRAVLTVKSKEKRDLLAARIVRYAESGK